MGKTKGGRGVPIRSNAKGEEMIEQVKDFFARYERANSLSDAEAIGALYADAFMFGGPNGVQVIHRDDFLKVVPKRKAYFSSMGLTETVLNSVEVQSLSSKYLQAKVTWRMTLRDESGSRNLDAIATYVLMLAHGDELSIVFQVDHQDLATVIKQTP
jgi:hypothetical protein